MPRTPRRLDPRSIARRARLLRNRAAASPNTDRTVHTGHDDTVRNGPAPAIRVEHVDDPERPFRLIRAAGVLGPSSIDRLVDAWASVTAPYALHLDLGDVRIDDAATMRRLETALDHLERQRIAIRIVGIDPYHPVLHG
jgi:hypothetical protein